MATNGNDWDVDDDDNQADGGQQKQPPGKGGLREHAKQVERERDELRTRLEKLEKDERTRSVTAAIEAKGYDPEVADLVPDSVAGDAGELEKWLTAKEKLFAPRRKQEEENVNTGFEEEGDPMNDDADAYGRMSRVMSGAMPPAKAQ